MHRKHARPAGTAWRCLARSGDARQELGPRATEISGAGRPARLGSSDRIHESGEVLAHLAPLPRATPRDPSGRRPKLRTSFTCRAAAESPTPTTARCHVGMQPSVLGIQLVFGIAPRSIVSLRSDLTIRDPCWSRITDRARLTTHSHVARGRRGRKFRELPWTIHRVAALTGADMSGQARPARFMSSRAAQVAPSCSVDPILARQLPSSHTLGD